MERGTANFLPRSRDNLQSFPYLYELRRGEEVVSTGHLSAERPLATGDSVSVAGVLATVVEILYESGFEPRLILEAQQAEPS